MVQIFSATNQSHGMEKKISVVGRGFVTPPPLFYKDPPILLTPSYQAHSHPHKPQYPPLFCYLVSLTEQVIAPCLMCYFT